MSRMCVIVPFILLAGAFPALAGGQACPLPGAERVNINAAGVDELDAGLKGVGRARAEAIVRWRETRGRFRSLADLDRVKGFGPALLEKNRDRIVFGD